MLQWSDTALDNLDEIISYFHSFSPAKALDFRVEIIKQIKLLDASPLSYPQVEGMSPNYRWSLVYSNKYKVYYKIKQNNIIKILYIRHASRRPLTSAELRRSEVN